MRRKKITFPSRKIPINPSDTAQCGDWVMKSVKMRKKEKNKGKKIK